MKTYQLTRTFLAVAVMAALTPAIAQTTPSATPTQAKPMCSTLNHPNAGKLADKSTGMAKEHSNSAVHMDCVPDGDVAAGGALIGATGSSTGTSLDANPSVGVESNVGTSNSDATFGANTGAGVSTDSRSQSVTSGGSIKQRPSDLNANSTADQSATAYQPSATKTR